MTRLLISCADRPGIVAASSRLLTDVGANIVRSDQHTTDPRGGTFFMRMEFDLQLDAAARAELELRFAREVAEPLGMQWQLWDAAIAKRVAILVSRQDHCLLDLLWRWRRGQLQMDVAWWSSNHADLREDVESFGLPFVHIPVDAASKAEAERRLLELLAAERATWSCSRATCRSSAASCSTRSACRRSTSTIPSCRRSPARTPTRRPTSAASS